MTNKTSIAFAFAFAAVMLAWPMTAQNVIADGDATITAECGFATPTDINLGAIAIGADSTEVSKIIGMTGTVTGTLELQTTDWTGVGTFATGSITLVSPSTTGPDTIEVNSLTYTAVAGARGDDTEFSVDSTDIASATDLVAAINGRDGGAVTATLVTDTNTILIAYDTLGTGGNAITLDESVADAGTTVFPTDGSLDGAEAAGVVHMQSEAIKYAIAVNDLTNAAVTYTNKDATGVDSQTLVLTTNTVPSTDTTVYLQASGTGSNLELLPYSGALESTFAFGSTCN